MAYTRTPIKRKIADYWRYDGGCLFCGERPCCYINGCSAYKIVCERNNLFLCPACEATDRGRRIVGVIYKLRGRKIFKSLAANWYVDEEKKKKPTIYYNPLSLKELAQQAMAGRTSEPPRDAWQFMKPPLFYITVVPFRHRRSEVSLYPLTRKEAGLED